MAVEQWMIGWGVAKAVLMSLDESPFYKQTKKLNGVRRTRVGRGAVAGAALGGGAVPGEVLRGDREGVGGVGRAEGAGEDAGGRGDGGGARRGPERRAHLDVGRGGPGPASAPAHRHTFTGLT